SRKFRDMAGSERCERDAPGEQLWLVEPLVGEPADLGHEPTAMFNRVPREEDPPRIVARPDPRAAKGDREHSDRGSEQQDTADRSEAVRILEHDQSPQHVAMVTATE